MARGLVCLGTAMISYLINAEIPVYTYVEMKPLCVNLGVQRVEASNRRYYTSFENQDSLHHASKATGSFKVTYIRFNGANIQWIVLCAILLERSAYCVALDWVSNRSASCVRLEEPSRLYLDAGLRICFRDEVGLRLATRLCDPGRSAVLVRSGIANNSSDRIPIPQSIMQTFDDKDSEALATRVAVSSLVEGPTATVSG